ncbi:hypothetical protein Pcar_3210 [Syntrophotalea carbinolica DSM 2380]|uniref:Uncharacterized protein n=1 Tax=Syntrophotalea carbinolica (strain DSM 2380 / NBRC 103641 / GraBd1) TaxID=338963 RepID=Q0C6V7_SYNC1|nr:hypothetical protein Pcar_3210 [Syntrophotalea carbinolica DSM 2380]
METNSRGRESSRQNPGRPDRYIAEIRSGSCCKIRNMRCSEDGILEWGSGTTASDRRTGCRFATPLDTMFKSGSVTP